MDILVCTGMHIKAIHGALEQQSGSNIGMIIGISAGISAMVAMIVVTSIILVRKCRKDNSNRHLQSPQQQDLVMSSSYDSSETDNYDTINHARTGCVSLAMPTDDKSDSSSGYIYVVDDYERPSENDTEITGVSSGYIDVIDVYDRCSEHDMEMTESPYSEVESSVVQDAHL